ncbi:MAG TPA: DUF6600 domain-containing protein [Bryobacteraceae bacterium]|nr:DUF6600 domain-containing protein [Bryobacteraceae bacterium]
MRKASSMALLLSALAVSAWADAGDPPSRVARLNLLLGPVSFRPGSIEDWAPATLNYPLTIGDHLWTEAGSKAELHVGSTAIRMDGQTALAVLNLDDRIVQLSVTGGAIDVHIRYLGENESFEVDTPNVAISLLRPGDYRINADGDQNTTFAVVRAGEAEVTGGGAAFPIRADEGAQITGTDSVQQQMGPAPPPDGFDQWAMDRDRREASIVAARYVPREMIGYEDLDQYGVWRNVPPYGWVWIPTGVAPGWAPYRFGHWAWVDPWGWTWIDDAPWGFAPFHYGRWAFAAGMWVWAPGRIVVGVRPVYAPALVAFVGGPRFGVAVGLGGGVGVAAWFPLGPGEVYRPAYHVSAVYVQNVNIVHVSNVTVIDNVTSVHYVNQTVVGAVTVVPHAAFAAGRPVAVAAVAVRPGVMAQAEIVESARVVPTREAVLGHGGAVVVVHAPPARFVERTVVARNAPPPPPVAFAAKEQALRANGGRPLDPAAENSFRSQAAPHPLVRNVVGANGTPAGGSGGGGPRPGFGGPRPGTEGAPSGPPARNDRPPSARPYNQTSNPPANQPALQPRPPVNNPTPAERTEAPPRNAETPHQESAPRSRENERQSKQTRKDTKKTEKQ